MNISIGDEEQSSQLQRLTSNAYTLIVRQEPERAKAFSGPKEKDRKPVDPPPIVQLRIRDPVDPTQNYLQSPYFFMCCNLCDADTSRPGQLAAALQGEDVDTATQSALAGTLVSSLHRLKDVDNTDGGFFVFPDLSVKLEGEFRLRFSLFEMLKTRVAYIKSVTSEPFTVFTPRSFPGMSESTFLSRSFGDQGVKLRIRKEPRVLGSKRSAPLDYAPQDTSHGHSQQLPSEYQNTTLQRQHQQIGAYGASGYTDSSDDLSYKRPRMSTDLARRTPYDQDQRFSQNPYIQSRDQYSQYPSREMTATSHGSHTIQTPTSTSASMMAGYSFGHQRNNSSSLSSPFLSPCTEYPGYSFSSSASAYQQPSRDLSYQYPQNQYTAGQGRAASQLTQSTPSYRQLPSSEPLQLDQSRQYARNFDPNSQLNASRAQDYGNLTSGAQYQAPQLSSTPYNRSGQSLVRTLPPPSQALASSMPNVLPPLPSTLPSTQPRRDYQQAHSNNGAFDMDANLQLASTSNSGQEGPSYLPSSYRSQAPG